MSNPIQNLVRPLVDTSVRAVSDSLSTSRDIAVNGAEWVARGRKPLHVVTESGLRLNTISHKSVARLVNVQAEMIEGTLEAVAKRLETAANANSVSELVNEQVALLPATRDRLTGDVRKALDVLSDTGDDLRDLFTETVRDFRSDSESAVEEAVTTAKRTANRTKRKASTAAKRAKTRTRKKAAAAKRKVTRAAKKAAE
ncbi:MAG: phasin family protein [Pseudomonadota bacterium]